MFAQKCTHKVVNNKGVAWLEEFYEHDVGT